MRFTRFLLIVCLLLNIIGLYGQNQELVVVPMSYDHAIRNPLKGFTTNSIKSHPWASTSHVYIKWNELENDESDSFEKILQVSNSKFGTVASQNKKVIPRVYLHWSGDNEKYWPADMVTDDYTSQQFQERVLRLVKRLGMAWDNDPRIAYIELGIFGKWGEHHSPSPTTQMQDLVGDAFAKAFKNKKVSVRHNWNTFTGQEFGEYWDSWAHYDQMYGHGNQIATMNDQGRYLKSYIGGEVAYDWGNSDIQPGPSPTHSVALKVHRDFIINTIRWLHCTQLRWIDEYDKYNSQAIAGAEEMQKAFGYRYELKEVRCSLSDSLHIAFDVLNTGSAPFYYDWPVEVALLDQTTHVPVWKSTMAKADIRKWLPGSGWTEPDWIPSNNWSEYYAEEKYTKSDTTGWANPPVINTVEESFKLDLAEGTYILAIAVLDPAGMLPSLRFASANYISGGRHPFGLLSIGTNECSPLPENFPFDEMADDNSLYYDDEFEVIGEFDPVQKPYSGTNWVFPTDSVDAWQYDIMDNRSGELNFRLDSAITIGIYGCDNTAGTNIRSYSDADQVSDAAQFNWDISAQTFQQNGQWLKYSVHFKDQSPYQLLVRARDNSNANFRFKIFNAQGETIFSRDINLETDFQNLGGGNAQTDWFLSNFPIPELWGNYVVEFDWYDNIGDPGIFGGFSFILSELDATPPTWIFATVGTIQAGTDIIVMINEAGNVYLVPNGTEADVASIIDAAISDLHVTAYTQGTIPSSDISAGDYILYAIDDVLNVSDASPLISIESLVDTTTAIYYPEATVTFQSDRQAIYVRSSNGIKELNIYNILGYRIKSVRKQGNEISIQTSELQNGIYLMQVIDLCGMKETEKIIISNANHY